MEFNLYSIRDVLNGFGFPVTYKSDELALRAFNCMKNDPNSFMAKCPDDFQLFSIGTFNSETGLAETWFPKPVTVVKKGSESVGSNPEA